ncbi:MAG: metallophosphoesterase [Candidatus Falkowbacteria bacterium]
MSLFILIFIILLVIAVYLNLKFLSAVTRASRRGRILILALLIIISFGFIVSQGLVHLFDNRFIRFFYWFFSLGVGWLFYLTLIAILFKLLKSFLSEPRRLWLAKIGFILATALFLIGVVNANFSQVKNVSVTLAGLPSAWQGKKIVQLSDIHLGSIYGPGFLRMQVAKVNNLNPDLIVITGDLFDGPTNRLPEFGQELAKLHAKKGIIFVSGNHDIYLGQDIVDSFLKNLGIQVLRDEMISLDGLEIIGFDFNKFMGDDELRPIKDLTPNSSTTRLFLNHTPNDVTLAKNLKVNLQLSGHTHRGQMFPMSFVTCLIYGKYQYGLHTEGTYNIYTSSGLGSWGPPVRTFNPAEIVSITIN